MVVWVVKGKSQKSEIFIGRKEKKMTCHGTFGKMEMPRMWLYNILNSLCSPFMLKYEQRSPMVY